MEIVYFYRNKHVCFLGCCDFQVDRPPCWEAVVRSIYKDLRIYVYMLPKNTPQSYAHPGDEFQLLAYALCAK